MKIDSRYRSRKWYYRCSRNRRFSHHKFGGEEFFGTEQDYDAPMFFSDNDGRLNRQERFRTFDGISAIQTTYYIVV